MRGVEESEERSEVAFFFFFGRTSPPLPLAVRGAGRARESQNEGGWSESTGLDAISRIGVTGFPGF